jgi:cytochrome P450
MADVLIADDPLYEELYDVRREAREIGNLLEEDVNPHLNLLRNAAPVHKGNLRELLKFPQLKHRMAMAQERDGYTCFSFDACEKAFRDGESFSTTILKMPSENGERRLAFLEMDDPEHRSHRAAMQPMFIRPRTLGWWRHRWIDEIVNSLIEALRQRERAELNIQFCARLPVHTITRAVGMDGSDSLEFRSALLKASAHSVTPEERGAAAKKVEAMLLDLIAKRRAEPGDDIVTGLIAAELTLPDGTKRKLTDREIMSNCRLVMLAGGGTTWRQCGITLWALLTHRDQLEALKADRSLVDAAIEESVRWNPTDPVFSRLVMRDAELENIRIPEGSVLDICLGAANRDPERWDNPDAYDLHRPFQGHLGFGIGTHLCMGQNVARAEIGATLNALFDAFPNMRLDPDAPAPYLTGGLEQRGMSAIPVILR